MSAASHTFGPPTSHSITASSVTLNYNISNLDPSFTDSTQESYTVHYSVHLPELVDPKLPVLLLCHPFNNSRNYWAPQIASPLLAPYPKVAFDSVGFAQSSTNGRPWSFDLAAASVLAALEQEESLKGLKAVLIGDSMGGGPTGLRVGMGSDRVVGVVACGTTAGPEDEDIAKGYDDNAASFADKCLDATPEQIEEEIKAFAEGMAQDGYTDSSAEPFAKCRAYGASVIAASLKQCLSKRAEDGTLLELEGKHAGETMKLNFRCLNKRKSLMEKLEERPSALGETQVLVVHGKQDQAYPAEREYAEKTLAAIGEANGELLLVDDGPHFITATHAEFLAEKIIDWIGRKCSI